MDHRKTIGFVFIDGFADWEFGMLSGATADWFGGRAVALSPGSGSPGSGSPEPGPLKSMGGFRLLPDRGTGLADNEDLDAVAVIGSDKWSDEDAPDIGELLKTVLSRGGIVGGICAGTLALARAGLFEGRKHTSNGSGWLESRLGRYVGAQFYQDVPYAIRDGHVVSAAGTAPGTFATTFLEAVFPEQAAQVAEMRQLVGREYEAGEERA
jgi:putative intracellular protease/amidase